MASVDDAPHVDPHDPRPVVEADLADRAADRDARVVDEQVGSAEALVGLHREELDLRRARHVAREGVRLGAARTKHRRGLFGRVRAVVGSDDPRASTRELEAKRASESAAGAGDDRPHSIR